MFKYLHYTPLQKVLDDLPTGDGEKLRSAIKEFYDSPDAIDNEQFCEVMGMETFDDFLKERFSDMRCLWEGEVSEGETYGYAYHLGQAIGWINMEFGFDYYGSRRTIYVADGEIQEKLAALPDKVADLLWNLLRLDGLSKQQLLLLDNDGYVYGHRLLLWCGKNIQDLDTKLMDQLREVAQVVDDINRCVMAKRAAAVDRGELERKDTGPKPFARSQGRAFRDGLRSPIHCACGPR